MVVKLLVLVILLVAQLTVEVGFQVLQGLGQGLLFLGIILQTQKHKTRI